MNNEWVPESMEVAGWQFYQNGKWHNGNENIKDHRKNTEEAGFPIRNVYATITEIKTEAEKRRGTEMPDKFYEALGWMHAECCAALDKGEDPRNFEVGDMVNRCIRDLNVDESIKTEAEKRREEQIEAICQLIPSKPRAESVSYEAKKIIAGNMLDAGYIKPEPLTDVVTDEDIHDIVLKYHQSNNAHILHQIKNALFELRSKLTGELEL